MKIIAKDNILAVFSTKENTKGYTAFSFAMSGLIGTSQEVFHTITSHIYYRNKYQKSLMFFIKFC